MDDDSDEAGDDGGVRRTAQVDRIGRRGGFGHEPDLAGAATDLVGLGVFIRLQRRQRLAEIDEMREARFPVAEEGKVFAQLLGLLRNGHAA